MTRHESLQFAPTELPDAVRDRQVMVELVLLAPPVLFKGSPAVVDDVVNLICIQNETW
jgi:hypothetical protein